MFGAVMGALGGGGGGGGLSASASSSSALDSNTNNNISSGTITVGGLNMGAPQDGFSSDNIIKGGAVLLLGLGGVWAFKKLK